MGAKKISPWQHNGGARKGAGRKPNDPDGPLDERVMIRVTGEQLNFLHTISVSPSAAIRGMIAARMARAQRAAIRRAAKKGTP